MICAKRTQSVLSILLALALTIGFVSCKKEEGKKKDEKKEEKTEAVVEWTTDGKMKGEWVIQGAGQFGKKGEDPIAAILEAKTELGKIVVDKDKKVTTSGSFFEGKTLKKGEIKEASIVIELEKDGNAEKYEFAGKDGVYYAGIKKLEGEALDKAKTKEGFAEAEEISTFTHMITKK